MAFANFFITLSTIWHLVERLMINEQISNEYLLNKYITLIMHLII